MNVHWRDMTPVLNGRPRDTVRSGPCRTFENRRHWRIPLPRVLSRLPPSSFDLMRTLIDGYNLMFALGLLGKRHGPDGFRKVRTRFLNDLATALGAVSSHQTTIVFDASDPPGHLPRESTYKGMTIVFAVDDESADERIERLIAAHSAPKSLTVVSTDHRIRQAANRRRARALTADVFWQELETRKRGHPPRRAPQRRGTVAPPRPLPQRIGRLARDLPPRRRHARGPRRPRPWRLRPHRRRDRPHPARGRGRVQSMKDQ